MNVIYLDSCVTCDKPTKPEQDFCSPACIDVYVAELGEIVKSQIGGIEDES
jgi:predicted nucleic acid-binding Zn ribbon protein